MINLPDRQSLRLLSAAAIIGWSVLLGGIAFFDLAQTEEHMETLAANEAHSNLNKDLAFREMLAAGQRRLSFSYGLIWLLGLGGILLLAQQVSRRLGEHEAFERELSLSNRQIAKVNAELRKFSASTRPRFPASSECSSGSTAATGTRAPASA